MSATKHPVRMVNFYADGPPLDEDDLVRTLAFFFTNGDPVGYCRRLREKQDQEEGAEE